MSLITGLLCFTSLHVVHSRENVSISIKRDFPKIPEINTQQENPVLLQSQKLVPGLQL